VSIEHAIEALRRPLAFAGRDDFAAAEKVQNLGAAVAAGALRVAEALGPDAAELGEELRRFAAAAARADEEGPQQRRIMIAKGLRLCARLRCLEPPAREPAPPPAGRRHVEPEPLAVGLAAPLESLRGCGPSFAARFAVRGIETVGDLLWFLPLGYEDRRTVAPLAALADVPDGTRVTTRGTVRRAHVWPRRFADLVVEDGGEQLTARWFRHHPGITTRFQPGDAVVLSGTLRRFRGKLAMAHPDVIPDEGGGAGVLARYGEVEGVPPRTVARLCRAACERAAGLCPDGLPDALRRRLQLPTMEEALRCVHLTSGDVSPEELGALAAGDTPAHRRLVFDEFFFLQLGLARRRALWRRDRAPVLPVESDPLEALRPHLGFVPTAAQERAAREVAADLGREEPMNRLLQGDVGSGKTVVAFAAALLAQRSGWQVALMAPTEILAEQHRETLAPWAAALGVRTALLTASTPRGVRESTLALAAAGRLDLAIGTHALLAERVGFDRLGLVIVDEQHRFGVAQRARLRRKGEGGGASLPHLLVMTATPIPRTLALTVYGDLDVTIIDELPPGRRPPATSLHVGARGRKQAWRRLEAELESGRQAFVICPRVEEADGAEGDASEREAVDAAISTAADLRRDLACARVGLVHGRLKPAEREATMRRFRAGEDNLLVATTVVEVGVDIPAAALMLILSADRFGLAQLHQLRGRIGRGGGDSACLLLCEPGVGAEAIARLKVLCDTDDGFRIAEADLALRGPGELAGTRQAGMPRLRFGDLARHGEVLRLARTEAFALVQRDPDLAAPEHAAARAVLESRWDPAALYGEEAG
jgi:ATP-dependent DNA helicase RecG